MIRVLIVSDSHGNNENVRKAVNKAGKVDMMFHLGDVGINYLEVERMCGMPTYIVAGNNDYNPALKKQVIIKVGNHTIYATHGHLQGVHAGLDRIRYAALENGCDIAMFGHIHVPVLEELDDITIINPGSLTFPRQDGWKKTFAIMEIDDEDNITYKFDTID